MFFLFFFLIFSYFTREFYLNILLSFIFNFSIRRNVYTFLISFICLIIKLIPRMEYLILKKKKVFEKEIYSESSIACTSNTNKTPIILSRTFSFKMYKNISAMNTYSTNWRLAKMKLPSRHSPMKNGIKTPIFVLF